MGRVSFPRRRETLTRNAYPLGDSLCVERRRKIQENPSTAPAVLCSSGVKHGSRLLAAGGIPGLPFRTRCRNVLPRRAFYTHRD